MKKKSQMSYVILAVVLVLAFIGYQFIAQGSDTASNTEAGVKPQETVQAGGDMKLLKADITEKASFYPYEEAGVYMEVIAVKAKDDTIRTALNTCQVCYDSGKGYYEQKGDTLVCQNCGNVFAIEDVEIVKGGCNPVPILQQDKTEDGEYITISGEFLAKNKGYFERWKK